MSGRFRHGDWAWISLAAGVIVYEVFAPENELMSQAVDRYRTKHPILTLGAICLIAAHLARAIPPNVDPIHRAAAKLNR